VGIRIGVVDNWDFNLFAFRRGLIRGLEELGEVFAISPDGEYAQRLREEGVAHIRAKLHRWIDPVGELKSALEIARVCRAYGFTVMHSCSPKASVAAQLGAWLAGTPVRLMDVQGLGYSFSQGLTPRKVAIRGLFLGSMKLAAGLAQAVVFLNQEDLSRLSRWRIVAPAKAVLINSCGIDLQHFRPDGQAPRGPRDPLRVVMIARLLREKGVVEYLDACAQLKARYGDRVECLLVGLLEPQHPGGVPREVIAGYEARGAAKFLGPTTDVREVLKQVDVLVHPSYYGEGVPKVLLEAAAMEKGIVAADNVGTREVITHGHTGVLVPRREVAPLVGAITQLLDDEPLRRRLGQAAREKVARDFDVRKVIADYVALYRRLLAAKGLITGGGTAGSADG
jgi:glycosyltransferase involved in cell wall biosynthesis